MSPWDATLQYRISTQGLTMKRCALVLFAILTTASALTPDVSTAAEPSFALPASENGLPGEGRSAVRAEIEAIINEGFYRGFRCC